MATISFRPISRERGPQVPGGDVQVPPRLEAPEQLRRPKWQIWLMAVMGLVFLGVIGMVVSNPAMRSGPMAGVSILFPLMMMASMAGIFFSGGRSGGGNNGKPTTSSEVDKALKTFFKDLDEAGDVAQDNAEAQFNQAAFYHPEPDQLRGFVGTNRMWEREPGKTPNATSQQSQRAADRSAAELAAVHFGYVRMGTGETKLANKFISEDQGDPADYEPASFDAERNFTLANRTVSGIAKPISLRRYPGLGLVGTNGMDPVYGLVRSMVLQATIFHSSNHLQVMVLTDNPDRWDWMKWLPHNQHPEQVDSGGSTRMVWRSLGDLEKAIPINHGRGEWAPGTTVTPHWLIICDQERVSPDWDAVTRSKLGGIAGVTFLRLAEERGEGLEFTDKATLYVTADAITDAKGNFFAKPDYVSGASARATARKMARYRPTKQQAAETESSNGVISPDLCELLGIADARAVDLDRLWAKVRSGPPTKLAPWSRDWGRFPFAVDEYGQTVALDFKETDFDGMGAHALCLGTSGSGKSEWLKTLITSMCATHPPDLLNIAFFDFKGSSTAKAVRDYAHMVACVSELGGDVLMDRMMDGIRGEGARRKRLLDRVGAADVYEYEYLRIQRGEKLEPLPWMFFIVDEFTQWAQDRPDEFKELTDWMARQGRGLGMSLILCSQYLGHQMSAGQGAMKNIPIRVCLRVLDENDSREMIGVPDAYHLPKGTNGAGFLKVVGEKRPIQFQTAYVSKVYEPVAALKADAVRARGGYVPPQLFTAAAMKPLDKPIEDPREEEEKAQAPVEQKEILGPDGRPLKQIQAFQECIAAEQKNATYTPRQIWCPDLTALPADELVKRLRGKPWYERYGENDLSPLRFAVGLEDRPFDHAQRIYAPDVTNSNMIVPGTQGSGRTTALATMILSAALTYTPRRVQFAVIALSGPDINDLKHLPHVVSFARGNELEKVRRSVAEMKILITEREAAFLKGDLNIDRFRTARFSTPGTEVLPDDPFGDAFLVIDGWNALRTQYEPLVAEIEEIATKGPAHGVHVVLSTDGWIHAKMTSTMHTAFQTNVELKLPTTDELNHNPNYNVAKRVPFGQQEVAADTADETDADQQLVAAKETVIRITGRGRSMFGYHFQTGRPFITVSGQDGPELVTVNDERSVAMFERIAGVSTATVRMLPEELTREAMWQRIEELDYPLAKGMVPFGISEVGLRPAVADFNRFPHLLLTGRAGCGKSEGLATVAQGIMDSYGPDEAKLYIVSPDHALVQYVPPEYLGTYEEIKHPETPPGWTADMPTWNGPSPDGPTGPVATGRMLPGYVNFEEQVLDMDTYLDKMLTERRRPVDVTQEQIASGYRSWTGPDIFVLVDNEHEVEAWAGGSMGFGKPFALGKVAGHVKRASELGLHVIVARRIDNWARGENTPLIAELKQALSPGLVMSGPRDQGTILGNTFAADQVAGRGIYVTTDSVAPAQFARPDRAGTPPRRRPIPPKSVSGKES